MIYSGEVKRGWLGVSIANMDQAMQDGLGLRERGVLINEVFENEPAARAGLMAGDVVMSLAGRRTPNANELRNVAASLIAGQTYKIEIIRNGKRQTLDIVPTVRGESAQASAPEQRQRRSGEPQTAQLLGMTLREENGVVRISEVEQNSSAARAGIRVADVLLSIKTAPDRPFSDISNLGDLNRETRNLRENAAIVIRIERGGQRFFVSLRGG